MIIHKIIKYMVWVLMGVFLLPACTQQPISFDDADAGYVVNAVDLDWWADAHDIYFRFNILDKQTDEKVLWNDLTKEHATFISDGETLTVRDLTRTVNQGGTIPENILVSLLVDRSIPEGDMEKIKDAVGDIVNTLPANTVYISFFDEQLRATKPINANNFGEFQNEFTVSRNFKLLFSVALKKFQELCGEPSSTANQQFNASIADPDVKKYLVLLTDGRVDENNVQTAQNIQTFSDYVQAFDMDAANPNRVEIHAIRFGAEKENVDFTLSYLCVDLRNRNVEGGLHIADPESFINQLRVSDKTQPDYELTVENPLGVREIGVQKDVTVRLKTTDKAAFTHTKYAIGTTLTPVKTGSAVVLWELLLFGFLIGMAIWGAMFVILQILIPFFRVYMVDFDKKYVRNYSFDDESALDCHFCLNEIRDGEEIVTKCSHIVHRRCWIENGCKCADYGENCKKGKQYFFDTKRLINAETRPFFTRFALWGLLAGLLTWLVFETVTYFFPYTFDGLITTMLSWFYPGYSDWPVVFLRYVYLLKINSLLMVWMILGCFAISILSFINKKRQRDFSVLGLCLKSLLGALCGFSAILLGSILLIVCKAAAINLFVDWIPWVLAGCACAFSLSLFTNVIKKYFVVGGIIAGFIGYICMFTGAWWGHYGILTGLMAMSATLGIAFISTRRTVHTYFLKYRGTRLAIYKWMNPAGGSEEVTIGKSADCTLCMDWDDHVSLRDVNVKLYIDKKDKLPRLKVVDEHIVYNHSAAKTSDEFVLHNGVKFKIGNTTFQYVEKY